MSSTTTTSTSKRSFMDGKKLWFVLSIVFALIAVVFVLLILRSITDTTNYYVLNKNVAARSEITAADLTERTAPTNAIPPTALDKSEFLAGRYAKYALSTGDILTDSNTAASLAPLTANLPSNYVAASFRADPSAAAGGNVQTGDYIDLYVVQNNSDTAASHLFLQHVKVLSATQDLDSATTTSTDTSDSSSSSSSSGNATASTTVVPYLFTVGVSQTDAAKIFTASQQSSFVIYVTLSSEDANDGKVNPVDVGAALSDIIGGDATDAGIGTATSSADTAKTQPERELALRTEVQKVIGIVNAYAQVNTSNTNNTAQAALDAAGYTVPKNYSIEVSGPANGSFVVNGTETTDGKKYNYVYSAANSEFTESQG